MIAGLEPPTKGDIFFDGKRVNQVEAEDRDIGMVFQNYALYPHMTVGRNIEFPLRMRHIAKAQREERVRAVAGMMQIEDLLNRRPSQLSGGQQQRDCKSTGKTAEDSFAGRAIFQSGCKT